MTFMDNLSSRFDLNLVRALVAIYETRSVTLAADRLELTQPTISYALGKLRTLYDDRLFSRGAQGLVPSALCERLYEQLSVALSSIECTTEARDGFQPQASSRRFRIAMSDIGALFFIPPLLRRFQAIAPHLQVEFVELSDSLMENLATGALDLAVGNLPDLHGHTREAFLFRERYVCLVAADHPTIAGTMDVAQFSQARHVMVTSPSSGHALISLALAQQGIQRNIVALVPQFSVLPGLVEDSDLLVILPERIACEFGNHRRVKLAQLPVPIPEFDVRVHWHARSENSPAHAWLRGQVIDILGKL